MLPFHNPLDILHVVKLFHEGPTLIPIVRNNDREDESIFHDESTFTTIFTLLCKSLTVPMIN